MKKETDRLEGILDLISSRSKQMDESLAENNKQNGNVFYDNQELRVPLEDFVKKLEKLLEYNTNVEKHIGKMHTVVDRIHDVSIFISHMEEIEALVGDIDSLIEVKDLEKLLRQIERISEVVKGADIQSLSKKVKLQGQRVQGQKRRRF